MEYLKLFAKETDFKGTELDLTDPTVALIDENDKIYIRPRCSLRLVFDIQDSVNQLIPIYNNPHISPKATGVQSGFRVISMSVDSVILKEPTANYTFTTIGRHIVRLMVEYSPYYDNTTLQILDHFTESYELVEVKFENTYTFGGNKLELSNKSLYSGVSMPKVKRIDMMNCPFNYNGRTDGFFLFDTNVFPNLEVLILPKNMGTTSFNFFMGMENFTGKVFYPIDGDYSEYIITHIQSIFPNAEKTQYDKDGEFLD